MRNLKIIFIGLGILSSVLALIWSGKTHALREGGINYVHNAVYSNPELLSKIGTIVLKSNVKIDAEQVGDKYFVRLYETVIVGGKDNSAIVVVVHENKDWRLWSFSLNRGEKYEEFVSYGQFNTAIESRRPPL